MKRMLIDANHAEETRVAILENKQILEFDFVSANKKQIKGNIYLAKITRVEPSLQAAFVEYGGGRQGFLPFSEIHPDYYQIPVSDRKRLLEEVEREMEEDEREEEAELEALQTRRQHSEAAPSSGAGASSGRRRGRRVRRRRDKPESAEGSNQDNGFDENQSTSAAGGMDGYEPDSNSGQDDDNTPPTTQYAKKDEPTISSEIVTGEEETPKRRGFRTRRRVTKKDAHAEESAPELLLDEAQDAAVTAQEDTRLSVTPPVDVSLGAALFSEDEAFALPEEKNSAEAISFQSENDDSDEGDDDEGDVEAEESIETLDSEEEAIKPMRKKRVPFFKRYKIQEVIKRGQIVLVQATKEGRGNKGASVTTYLSLAGRYCVLMPNSPRDGGVSRKISDIETRKRLKDVMSQLTLARGMSVIIRTAGMDRNRTEIRRDFDYLVKLWNQIRETTLSANAPALIYEENNLIKRAIRDLYTSDIDDVMVEGEEGFIEARDFMKMLMPSHTSRVKQYSDDMPLFYANGIEEQLGSMHDPVVKLKSGGYLVINPTEALISIDVNSGRSTGERNIEETAVKNNIEAAHEVARQLRLRDLAGLIVIDFIDMMDSRNRRAVERNLKDALRSDRAKIQVGRISPFGLLEMSRQRLRPSIGEAMHTNCPTCAGRGLIRAPESLGLHVVRTLEKEAVSGRWSELKLKVSQEIAMHLLNFKRSLLTQIEQRQNVIISIEIDPTISISDFTIEKIRGVKPERAPRAQHQEVADSSPVDAPASNGDEEESAEGKRRSRGGRGRNRRGKRGGTRSEMDDTPDTDAAQDARLDAMLGDDDGEAPWPTSSKDVSPRPISDDTDGSEADDSSAPQELPEFTKHGVLEEKPPAPAYNEENNVIPMAQPVAEVPPDTSRPSGAPPRKGWWQQMIELD